METTRGMKKTIAGIVSSNKMDKTIVITVERRVKHPIYGKYFKLTKKYMAHDPKNDCQEGDLVRIIENRPLSRNKRWRLLEIIERVK